MDYMNIKNEIDLEHVLDISGVIVYKSDLPDWSESYETIGNQVTQVLNDCTTDTIKVHKIIIHANHKSLIICDECC